jgi:hypothetical protein
LVFSFLIFLGIFDFISFFLICDDFFFFFDNYCLLYFFSFQLYASAFDHYIDEHAQSWIFEIITQLSAQNPRLQVLHKYVYLVDPESDRLGFWEK